MAGTYLDTQVGVQKNMALKRLGIVVGGDNISRQALAVKCHAVNEVELVRPVCGSPGVEPRCPRAEAKVKLHCRIVGGLAFQRLRR